MAAYCLFDIIKIHDEEAMNEYRNKVFEVVNKFEGKYIVIGNGETKEGVYKTTYPVMIEFPSIDKAEAWYSSKEYSELKSLRLSAVISNAIFFDGYSAEGV